LTALSECLEPSTASRIFIEDFLEVGDPRDPTVHILSPLANVALTEQYVFDLGQSMQTEQPEVAAVIKNVKGYRADERRVAVAEITEYDRRKKSGDTPEKRMGKKVQSGKYGARCDVGKREAAPIRTASGITQQKRLEPAPKNNLFEYWIDKCRDCEAQRLTQDPR